MQEDNVVMMDSPRSGPSGTSKTPLIAGFALLLIAVAAAWFVFQGPSMPGSKGVKAVASLDSEAIYGLDEFVQANKKIEELTKKKSEEFENWARSKNPRPSQQEAALKAEEMQLALQQERNKLLNPLFSKAEAAVAVVARKNGFKVVLDKRIVVFGVKDITEDVKKVFQSGGEIKLPEEQKTDDSPVAYFDQDVVRNLKAFQEVDLQLLDLRRQLGEEAEAKLRNSPNMSPQEQETLQKSLMLRFQARQEQLQAPLIQDVNQSVKEVSEEQAIALVLNKQHVMYGGRNITDEVVETFLKKRGGSAASQSAPESSDESRESAPASEER
ncbi:MAG: OmpH family outer membrane protein [Candidatus Eremiobacterota bacterium]